MKETRTLIAYFSRKGNNYLNGRIVNLPVGNTEVAAKLIQSLAGGDLFHIDPITAYPTDYNETTDVAQRELNQNARPEFRGGVDAMGTYDVVVLGYPNWWGTMPMVMFTFLGHYDLTGKSIIPFCTNEGSGLGSSERDLKKLCSGAEVLPGLSIHGAEAAQSEEKVAAWAKKSAQL